jgi:phage tail tube protein FII
MSITMNLRYQKQSDYGDEIFIVSQKFEEEKDSHATLCRIEKKLKDLDFGTFLPVFSNDEHGYATIRFKFYNNKQKLNERDLYSVNFDIKHTERDGKDYLNCMISDIKLFKKAKPQDYGKVIDLGF